MQITIEGSFKIRGAPQAFLDELKIELSIANPDYNMVINLVKKYPQKRGMLYNNPEFYEYFKEEDDVIEIGRGCKKLLARLLFKHGLKPEIVINRSKEKMTLEKKIKERDYQEGVALKVLESPSGIPKLGTGWGKTHFALRLCEETQLRTLIVCCDSEALEFKKYRNEFKKIYGYEIGVIDGDKMDIKNVTVTKMSTLKNRDIESLKMTFGMIILDEIQSGMSPKILDVVMGLAPSRMYGMTATPGRMKGQSAAVNFYYGDILIDLKVPTIPPDVHIWRTNALGFGTDWTKMEKDFSIDPDRNALCVGLIKAYLKQGRHVLFLTKRVAHGEVIRDLLIAEGIDAYAFSSKGKKKEKEEAIEGFRDETRPFQVLIGNYRMFSTGMDIPILDTVILGMSIKAEETYAGRLLQGVGRVRRKHDTKQKPLVIDLRDKSNKITDSHFKTRLYHYKKEGWKIVECN